MLLTASITAQAATIAGSATVVSGIRLHHARRWHLVVKNTHGSQTLTACRIRRYAQDGSTPGPWESITTGLPVAAGASLSIRETDDCSDTLDLELTASGADTPVTIDLAGV